MKLLSTVIYCLFMIYSLKPDAEFNSSHFMVTTKVLFTLAVTAPDLRRVKRHISYADLCASYRRFYSQRQVFSVVDYKTKGAFPWL